MIPATSFLLDGDIALWVTSEHYPLANPVCIYQPGDTFDIEVENSHCAVNWPEHSIGDYNPSCCRFPKSCSAFPIRHRVHVIDVLPIHDWCPDEKPADHICHAWKAGQQSEQWWHHRSFDRDDWTEREITLPPDAEPGMWLVRLKVHVPENVEEPT